MTSSSGVFGEDGDPVVALLAVDGAVVAAFLDLHRRKGLVDGLDFLQQGDIGLRRRRAIRARWASGP